MLFLLFLSLTFIRAKRFGGRTSGIKIATGKNQNSIISQIPQSYQGNHIIHSQSPFQETLRGL
jgi:hypothetical protein